MEKGNDPNDIVAGDVCKSLVVLVVVQEVVLPDDRWFQTEVPRLIVRRLREGVDTLDIKTWATLVSREIAE